MFVSKRKCLKLKVTLINKEIRGEIPENGFFQKLDLVSKMCGVKVYRK